MAESSEHRDDKIAARYKLWGGLAAGLIGTTAVVVLAGVGFFGSFQTKHAAEAQAAEIEQRDDRQDAEIQDGALHDAAHDAMIQSLQHYLEARDRRDDWRDRLLFDLAVRNGVHPAPIPKPSH